MKKSIDGHVWTEEVSGTINIGFTKAFIDDVLGECFHVTQSNAVYVNENKPLLTIETMSMLKVIKSPVSGTVLFFNNRARDFPDKLTEEEVVVTIRPKSAEVVTPAKSKTKATTGTTPVQVDWNGQIFNPPGGWAIQPVEDDWLNDFFGPGNNNNNIGGL